MPRPSLRTRSVKRRNLKTPGSRFVTHYHRRQRPAEAKCAACGAALSGIPRLAPSKMSNTAKGKKKPNRPYGGYLCPDCLSEMVRAQVLGEPATRERLTREKTRPETPVREKQAPEKPRRDKEETEKAKKEKRKKTGKSK